MFLTSTLCKTREIIILFIVGEKYSRRKDIHDRYGGGRQSGISPSSSHPFVFIFTGDSGASYGYEDGWLQDEGFFLYTGQGQIGDMQFKLGNKAIRDHVDNGKRLLLFEALGKGKAVKYLGEFKCASVGFGEGLDKKGNSRKTIRFYLAPIDKLLFKEKILGKTHKRNVRALEISSSQTEPDIKSNKVSQNKVNSENHPQNLETVTRLEDLTKAFKFNLDENKNPKKPVKKNTIEKIQIRNSNVSNSLAANNCETSKLKGLIELHPEIIGEEEGIELEFDYETTLGSKIPLLIHAPGKEKFVVGISDYNHDREVFKELGRVVRYKVELAIELDETIASPNIKSVLFVNEGSYPVTSEKARKYNVLLVYI